MATDPMVADVNLAICSGCGMCVPVCPYKAIELVPKAERVNGKQIERLVAQVNSGLCQGCGACNAACRAGAINVKGYTDDQILAEVDAICL